MPFNVACVLRAGWKAAAGRQCPVIPAPGDAAENGCSRIGGPRAAPTSKQAGV